MKKVLQKLKYYLEEYMKLIKNLILGLLIFFNFTGCFGGGVKLKSTYNDKNELKNDILNALHTQYGIEFEVQKPQNGQVDSTFIKGKEYGFIDYLVPKEYIDLKEQWLYIYRTVCDNIGTFDTQAHVYMFEKQLRTDVDEILTNIGIKYDILNFRGMDRDIHKWSTRDSYDYYKTTKDYETWIFIKLDKSTDEKDYPKVILPMLKKIYSALEPAYNPTVLFYVDEYERTVYTGNTGKPVRQILKNCILIWIDLSKYKNIMEWTELKIGINPLASKWIGYVKGDTIPMEELE